MTYVHTDNGFAIACAAMIAHYVQHINMNPDTIITRFYGLHKVKPKKERSHYIVVMANVLNSGYFDMDEIYDLKVRTVFWIESPRQILIRCVRRVLLLAVPQRRTRRRTRRRATRRRKRRSPSTRSSTRTRSTRISTSRAASALAPLRPKSSLIRWPLTSRCALRLGFRQVFVYLCVWIVCPMSVFVLSVLIGQLAAPVPRG